MALDLGGRRAEAERAYEWLVDLQRADGSWHQYYIAGDDGSTQVEQDKLDANVCAYVAAGVWHHWLLTDDRGLRRGDVARRRAGHRLRARPADAPRRDPLGPPRRRHPVELRPAHRLVVDLPQPALRHRHRRAARPRAARLGALGRPAGPRRSADVPDAFAPKHRWAMDWYYPVLGGVVLGDAGASASTSAATRSSWRARASAACPTALGHRGRDLRVRPGPPRRRRPPRRPTTLFGWAQQFRHDEDGRYWTGTVFPDEVRFPGGERSHLHRRLGGPRRRRPRRRHPRVRALRRDHRRPPAAHATLLDRARRLQTPTRRRTRRLPTAPTSSNRPDSRAGR